LRPSLVPVPAQLGPVKISLLVYKGPRLKRDTWLPGTGSALGKLLFALRPFQYPYLFSGSNRMTAHHIHTTLGKLKSIFLLLLLFKAKCIWTLSPLA
jgi:hypothetical protein